MSNRVESPSGRETRLLILVVGVAVAVLLLLARWQFPAADLSMVAPSAAPLAGLAARATFDEMAATMTDVLGRVSPFVVIVPLAPVEPEPEAGRRPARAADDETPEAAVKPVFAAALRVRRDLALMHVPDGLVPQAAGGASVDVVAHDVERRLMVVRVPQSSVAPDTLSASIRTFPGFLYVAAVEATPLGPTIQPVFVGRADAVADPLWSHPLVPASVGPGLAPGALLFGLNSRFAGMVVDTGSGPMIVPAPALETLVQTLEGGSAAP